MGRKPCTEPQCLYNSAPLPLPIPLLPPMGRTACTEPQCLYNGTPLTLPIPLLPLWAVRPVQSLSACTTVHLYPCFSDGNKCTFP